MNEPAMISFFSVAGVILLFAGVAIWRTRRTSRMHIKANDTESENGGDPRHGNQGPSIRVGDAADVNGQADSQGGNWRWKKIIDTGSWAKVPNGVADQEEMRAIERRHEKPSQVLIPAPTAGVKAETSHQSGVEKRPRPQDVPSFENLGGYRFGGFTYGHDNMAALPVPASIEDHNPCRHSPGIAEVEAVPASSYPPARTADRASVESGHGARLTSYNGLPPMHLHRDDMMAALPIPKDHPLYQHHPVVHCSAPAEQDPDRRTPFEYERDSLVPAPLNPRRGKHNPDVDQNREPVSTTEPTPAAVLTWERPWSAHSRPASASRSTSRERSETRYSSFESPLRQHPPELSVGSRVEFRNEWPLTTETKLPVERYSIQSPKQPASVSDDRHQSYQRHRQYSSCDAAWTTVPLTPSSRSSGKPSRWSWTAEDFKVMGIRADNIV
ncbi:hypothetical protein AYL99_10396 [Fonsecaea erecta]|uniref:Uncharacterized protein n=1 Tax=Fonsecaea erecta TaxID=1367422 RepID=A0A178Z8C0_9EURO|nr:hypothetical protein AYL99_10396 [Fonsecaea erecta]OAP55423.1 hypothetical protein AYL99_10396 [Fonsecaea erecta]